MLHAWSKGLLSQINYDDERWPITEELALYQAEREIAAEYIAMLHNGEVSAAQYVAGAEAFKHHHEKARELVNLFGKLTQPQKFGEHSPQRKVVDELIKMWEENFGKWRG